MKLKRDEFEDELEAGCKIIWGLVYFEFIG